MDYPALRALLISLALLAVPLLGYAAQQSVTVAPGDSLAASCSTSFVYPTVTTTAINAACATPATATIEGVPICADHDATKWHGLVKRNADNSIRCTYGHTHMDDPRVLDGMFGHLDQEISYPWQTTSALGEENRVKHNFYDWAVVKDSSCLGNPGSPLSLDNARLEYHGDGNPGATVRFHSFMLQARVCSATDPSYHGTISMGGHVDYGILESQRGDGSVFQVPLPGDPAPGTSVSRRIHAQPGGSVHTWTWYGNNGIVFLGVGKEAWGPVDPDHPSTLLLDGDPYNASTQQPLHLVNFNVQPGMDALDGVQDGKVTFHGFTDRHGTIVPDCAPVGVDCVPLDLVNVKLGQYEYRADTHGVGAIEYDVMSPSTGKSLIAFPN